MIQSYRQGAQAGIISHGICCFTRKDDKLPERFYKEPTPIGLPIVKGKTLDKNKINTLIEEYYEIHGWDNNGIPTEETIKKLGIETKHSNRS